MNTTEMRAKLDDLTQRLDAMKPQPLEPGRLTDHAAITKFIQAGNARFTLRSAKTDKRYTYRMTYKAPDPNHPKFRTQMGIWFVSVLTGPDNEANYTYLGFVKEGTTLFVHGDKSKISPDAPSATAFRWFWTRLIDQKPLDQLEFFHEGRCGHCARPLTDPISITTGFGPDCSEKLGIERVDTRAKRDLKELNLDD